ncbi:unnamed protein product [Mytilus edulis]|uniref:Uncharacterized protein n=1 Tax=Mytilus edulis TaxID=6550 RepID=A0A8S3SZQ7_MYTED|nr:unnamed protein product [Mytilus edulis]
MQTYLTDPDGDPPQSHLQRTDKKVPGHHSFIPHKPARQGDFQTSIEKIKEQEDLVIPNIKLELKQMASALLKKALRIPGKRIKYLFEQYIAFRSVQDSRERLQGILDDPELASDVKTRYRRLHETFNEVLAETGVLLVHPLFQRNKVTGQVYSQMAQTIKRDDLKKLLRKRQRMTNLLKLPPVCVGSSMVSKLQPQPPSWKG